MRDCAGQWTPDDFNGFTALLVEKLPSCCDWEWLSESNTNSKQPKAMLLWIQLDQRNQRMKMLSLLGFQEKQTKLQTN